MSDDPVRRWPRRVFASGSEPDPRFTLANERTMLAWVRTALAFVVTGLAAAVGGQVLAEGWVTAVVAVVMAVLGAVIAVVAFLRWQQVEIAIRQRRPLPAPRAITLVLGGVLVLAAGTLVALL